MTSQQRTISDLLPYLSILEANISEVSLPGSITLDFDVFLPGNGWYAPERNATTWFRWLNDEATISIMVNRSNALSGELYVLSYVTEEVLDGVQIFCDELPIESKKIRNQGGWIYQFEIPSLLEPKAELTTLRIRSAFQQKFTGDPRALSVAFSKIVITQTKQNNQETDSTLPLVLKSILNDAFTLFSSKPSVDNNLITHFMKCRAVGAINSTKEIGNEHLDILLISILDLSYANFEGSLSFKIIIHPDLRMVFQFKHNTIAGSIKTIFPKDFELVVSRSNIFSPLIAVPKGTVSRAQLKSTLSLIDALPAAIEQLETTSQCILSQRVLSLLRKGITLDMSRPLEGIPGIVDISGISHAELWPCGFVRWTASKETEIILAHLPEQNIILSLFVEQIYQPCLSTSIQLKCGSIQYEIPLLAKGGVIQFKLDATRMGKKIRIIMPGAVSPYQIGEGSDQRALCLALRAIHINVDDQE